ncbi:MAG: 3-isopropylmalate dehydratase small subunit [Candidatus Electryonea clarkiae]|nr:3-isopropylmalate dehydratase small subunit [Candidatus Electryonea clarkiae]MDP8286424.1 3-isopropylmalate dehydratase small subunit [Candidatus Electryonea clarkiae]
MEGTAFKYGNNVDTDVIIPARYCTSFLAEELAPHALEDLDDTFVKRVNQGDFIVAGRNFGCGSSRENAPIAIKGAGAACVIAESFARIFYRNSINIGLPILECPEAVHGTEEGDKLHINLETGEIENLTRGGKWIAAPFPEGIQEIIELGGLVSYVKKRLGAEK